MPSKIDVQRKEKALRRENRQQAIIQPKAKEVKKYPLRISNTTVIMVERSKCNAEYAEEYRRRLDDNFNNLLKKRMS